MSHISTTILLLFLLIGFGESENLFQNVMNKELYIKNGQKYYIPTSDTVADNQNFKFDPIGNLRIIKSGTFNFKQKEENKNEAFFRVCSNNGKCLGEITFCYLTTSETDSTSFCPSGQDGLQFEMAQNGLLTSDPKIGLVEWAGTSCAIFGYLNENIVFGPSYANFSLASAKMDFQKLPNSTFNQFLASLNLPNDCSIEPIDSSVLIQTASESPINKNEKESEAETETADLIYLLYIGTGVLGLLDLVLGIIIIIVIILEKRRKNKERKKEMEERLKLQTAIIAFEARKQERERQRKERKQKLEKAKPLKHINTESEKIVIETRPQRLYVPERGILPEEDENKNKRSRYSRKDFSEPASISEKLPSQKSKKKKDAKKKKTSKKTNSTQTSRVSKSESQQQTSSGIRML